MKKNVKIILSALISTLFVSFGLFGSYIIHKNMKYSSLALNSSLGTMADLSSINNIDKSLMDSISENQKFVVSVYANIDKGVSQGSGFLYNDKGDIITNAHVVGGSKDLRIKMADNTIYSGTVIGKSTNLDVALIRVPALKNKTPLKVDKDYKASLGDEVIAIGSPHGLENAITTGIINGLNRTFTIEEYKYKNMYQITAPVDNGSSGGPLLDKKTGEVIGINSAKSDGNSIGYSIPINQVLQDVDAWSKNPAAPVTTDITPKYKYEDTEGKKISSENLVKYFYSCINSKDYVAAYALLGSEWQSKTDYNLFRKGFLTTKNVDILSISSNISSDNSITIVGIINSQDTSKTDKYKVIYTVDYENNVLKILKGSAQKLK